MDPKQVVQRPSEGTQQNPSPPMLHVWMSREREREFLLRHLPKFSAKKKEVKENWATKFKIT
jgi:hypothetical protein